VSGAFVGSVSALLALVVIDLSNRRLIDRLRTNFHPIPWMYVAAGVATSAALLAQFRALELLPAWVVGALQGTQVIWTIMLSVIVLGSEERITRRLVLNVLVVVAGVFLIAVTV